MTDLLLKDTAIGKRIARDTWLDTGKYARYFYPGRFNLDFDPQLTEIFDTIDAKVKMPNGKIVPKHNKINLISWRGRGKTTIAKTILAKRLRFDDVKLAVYIGKNHDWAAVQTENTKRGMFSSKKEREFFGTVKANTISREMQEMFSKKAWITSTGALVTPRGCGQPVRGLVHDYDEGSYRCGLILMDDLMDKKFINSEMYRNDTYEWILTDVSESVPAPEMSMDWQIIYIDTLKHNDASNERLSEAKDWVTLRMPLAVMEEGHLRSLAPSFYTDEQVLAKYKDFDDKHKLDLFYQEYMCIAVATEDAPFKANLFKHYEESDEEFMKENAAGEIENVVLVDPAKTAKMSSAWSAVVGVGVNTRKNKIYVRDVDAGFFHPTELYDKIFRMAQRLTPCHVIGLETHSLHEFIMHPFLDEMSSRGLYYEVIELRPRRSPQESEDRTFGKEGRVGALASYYRKGAVYHNRSCCMDLEAQLLSFPRPKRWDVMDAFAYIVQILEMGLRYFENAEEDEYEDPMSVEREFLELEKMYEEPLEDWRII